MKRAICLILALLTACAFSAAFAEAEASLAGALSETCCAGENRFECMCAIALASQGKLILLRRPVHLHRLRQSRHSGIDSRRADRGRL